MTSISQLIQWVIRGAIRAYQLLVSPVLPGSCRFTPSCSEYAHDAIGRLGVLAGGWLAVKRLVRCHPWGSSGFDPVPTVANGTEAKTAKRPGASHCPAGLH